MIDNEFLNILGGGNTPFGQPAPTSQPSVPSGYVDAGGITVPQGAPQPGQLGSPMNPLTAAQVQVLNAPNEQYVPPVQQAANSGDFGALMNLAMPNPNTPTPSPMNNMEYAQQYGSTKVAPPAPVQSPTDQSRFKDTFLGGGNNLMSMVLGGQ